VRVDSLRSRTRTIERTVGESSVFLGRAQATQRRPRRRGVSRGGLVGRADRRWLAAFADYFDDPDLALAALRRSYVDFNGTNVGMIWRPYRNPLRSDPRFKDILRDVGLVDYFHDSGNWGDYCRPISGGADFECN
jgi:hypothetical protein